MIGNQGHIRFPIINEFPKESINNKQSKNAYINDSESRIEREINQTMLSTN
jgi:hypothetical protein